ncbi:DUF6221 family protein [Streptomyces sp. 1222.5]|uniref:DUF6221 family protein n=1 Tax=Streptomyces sp. 1222.5 TaxID=1881026 RepID=UPI003D73BC31
MEDLVQFLRAQLDEDERIARAPHSLFLTWDYDDCVRQVRDLGNGNELANVLSDHSYGEHIAEHDPARVLCEIDAKRKRIGILADAIKRGHDDYDTATALLPLEALPYVDRPGYREEWRP